MAIFGYPLIEVGALALAAFLVGVSKTGVPGVGILNVPLLANFFPAKASTGLLLPLLAITDIAAVLYYRRHARWPLVVKLLPWALAGIGAGAVLINYISDEQLKPAIGLTVLIMLAINYWRTVRSRGLIPAIPTHWSFAAGMGLFAGLTTQLANAAGPVMIIYLLAMRLPKNEFIGTGAWYFLILNWIKMPLFILDGRISSASLAFDLLVIPLCLVGAVVGIYLLKKIPQTGFNLIVQLLAAAAALKLTAGLWPL